MINNLLGVFFFYLLLVIFSSKIYAKETFWKIQAIDTMKYSRDRVKDPIIFSKIPALVSEIANLKPTHIAVNTPYDEEFYPVLKKWVDEIRKYELKVWFRGNLSSWEGWFDYPKFINIEEHHQKISLFIRRHPELFTEGDIFTPVPEPENGVIGDPRSSPEGAKKFNEFLVNSYLNCQNVFQSIGKGIDCGFFSTNGDIAKMILTKEIVAQIGQRVVIDHYVKNPENLIDDIQYLYKKLNAKIVLGEFGAPIKDIHGIMNEEEQANYIRKNLLELAKNKAVVEGINYWTAFDGSTSLYKSDLQSKAVVEVIKDYFQPGIVRGRITNAFGQYLKNIQVKDNISINFANSNSDGFYELLLPAGVYEITTDSPEFFAQESKIVIESRNQIITQDYELEPKNKNLIYYLQLKIAKYLKKLKLF